MVAHHTKAALTLFFVGLLALPAIVAADVPLVAVGHEPGASTETPPAPHPAVSIRTALSDSAHAVQADATAPILLPDRVAAYYFHATIRCHGCLWIEATTDSTIRTAFAPALEEGRLEWRSINFEEPENQALAQQLKIEGSTLVIAQVAGGEIVRSEQLDQTWDLVGKSAALFDLVHEHIAEYLGEKTAKPEVK
jgi:hypothetical protein